jgi:NAD(P)-dependent dehydrogenase (short-subunit alcohol dehydrogenase family)
VSAFGRLTPALTGTALVTGATRGIGAATARRLAQAGARVAVNDISRGPAMDAIVAEIGGVAAPADVSDRVQVDAMLASLDTTNSPLTTLVCNAAYMSMHKFLDHPLDDWWKVVNTNLTGAFNLIQAVLPGMRRAGQGRIVIISSYWGVIGWPDATAYTASKAGLIALTKSLGRELAPTGIAVNAVAPGVIATDQLRVDADSAGVDLNEIQRRYAAGVPLGRIGQPEEIAAAVAFLARQDIGVMIGQTLHVNGGEVRSRA